MRAVPAQAQAYPQRPIRLIVPFAAGGGTDFVARTAAPAMAEALGQPIVIDNRGGANGVIGTEMVASAEPDGYTLLLGAAGTLVVAPHLQSNLPFETMKDFAPISLLGTSPFVVSVHPSLPVRNIEELIALAKSQPGKLTFGSSGTGGAPHLATELFKSMSGVDMVHVPYKGLAPAVTDLLGGQIQVLFADVGLVLPHIRTGKVKALAVSSGKRSSTLPDLPTVDEAGVRGYAAGTWYGLLAPASTPPAIVARISKEAVTALQLPDIRKRFAAQGTEPAANSPEEFRKHIEGEYAKWGKVIKDARIELK
jgi:tripartite-type tricarboxylate transporter receptor subunit TctC